MLSAMNITMKRRACLLAWILISRVRINSSDEKFAFKLNTSSSTGGGGEAGQGGDIYYIPSNVSKRERVRCVEKARNRVVLSGINARGNSSRGAKHAATFCLTKLKLEKTRFLFIFPAEQRKSPAQRAADVSYPWTIVKTIDWSIHLPILFKNLRL